MPDVKEVYEMVTKQKPSDPGALERQRARQVRTMRNRKVGAFAVAAAIGLVAVAVIVATRAGQDAKNTVGVQPTATPVDVARSFVEAYGALDAAEAMSYLTDDADISGVTASIGAEGTEGTPDDLPLHISWLEATGYRQLLDSCEETGRLTFGTQVRCTFDFHNLRSDQLGRGPYSGSYLDLVVQDGQIPRVSKYWETEGFSTEVWEPFERWVSDAYPKDLVEMYQGANHSGVRLTEESIRLWERHTKQYVRDVNQGQ